VGINVTQRSTPSHPREGTIWQHVDTGEKKRFTRGKWVRYRRRSGPLWTKRERRILEQHFATVGATGIQKQFLPRRSAQSIAVYASRLGLKGPGQGSHEAPKNKLDGEALESAVAMREEDPPVAWEEIGRRLALNPATVMNGVCRIIAERNGTAAERAPNGRLTDAGIKYVHELMLQGLTGNEIVDVAGISASAASRERRRYKRKLRKAGKKLPPPKNGESYSGAKVPKEKKREVEALFIQGFGTLKIYERTHVSKTVCLRIRTKLVKRLARKGQCLAGCDLKGVRRRQKESARFVQPEQITELRELLLDRVPVSAAAKMVGMGGSNAYRERDRLKAELEERGEQLPAPLRMGKRPYPVSAWPRESMKAWTIAGPTVEAIAAIARAMHETIEAEKVERVLAEAKRKRDEAHERAAQLARDEAERARRLGQQIALHARAEPDKPQPPRPAKRRLTFEEQLARVEAGAQISIVPTFTRADSHCTLGGVVGEINI
jgi:hypothetical protein